MGAIHTAPLYGITEPLRLLRRLWGSLTLVEA